jgi:pantoate--beta-alanine ligase
MQQQSWKKTILLWLVFCKSYQFNNPEDLSKYPRTLEEDIKIALNPNIIVYAPVDDIYEGKVLSQPFDFDGLEIKWKESSDQAILTV